MILVLDQGTTSSRAILFNHSGEVVHFAQKEHKQYFPRPSWVEHDPAEIWDAQLGVAKQCLNQAGITTDAVVSLGIANQRETTVLWDRRTGKPIAPAIVWQDRRTSSRCQQLREAGYEPMIREKTGLVIDPYFCATKIEWLLNNVEGARQQAERGHLAFGTIDSWLIWNLTQGEQHATDATNASRTLLWNLQTRDWDEQLLELFGIPRAILPRVQNSSSGFGSCAPAVFGSPLAIGGVAGDQQAALMGQNCTTHGMAKNTYGTGCFALMNIGASPVHSEAKLLTTAACSADDEPSFALEGSIFVAGAAVQWLRDELGIIRSAAEVEKLAASVEDSGGVVLVPAFVGLGAPHWDAEARGGLLGITRGTNRAHIARAALEGIAFQVSDVLKTMQHDSGVPIDELRVDGGAARNDLLMQFQADILGTRVIRPQSVETTAAGAGFLAGLSSGFWRDVKDIESIWQVERAFEPAMSADERDSRLADWTKAVGRCLHWQTEG